ncbi:hypothetical protein CAC42_7422 [Sphaceloma murrayae]|uniref:Carotenoid oxygenase n=1 Tax=Sphaceloma murrayae TaxID=2082308 RepID=A0A2K1QWZ9_9PEZI|nr:hypothetical protein CAC42_7422 [Sphaceloma murrayae]
MSLAGQKRKRGQASAKHPYLAGNFAPIQQIVPLTPCTYQGHIPEELAGGEYVRNGGNPVSNQDLGRDAHWFDGDGMLSGVAFKRCGDGSIQPEFVNQYVLTDVYLSTVSSPHVKTPILPSIATLVNPVASFFWITFRVLRTILLICFSFLSGSKQAIKKISVANTSVWFHDGRALAGCESGPPMRISLPGLDTVGWYDGCGAENEPESEHAQDGKTIGGEGLLGWMREWTTAHPKVDPVTKEMLLFHSSFAPPYVQYSVIPEQHTPAQAEKQDLVPMQKYVNLPVPGVTSAKMMHDFGVSSTHSIIMDLPLSLDPLNMVKGKPVVEYDPTKPSRFGVFPRHDPQQVRWFETTACCIFHTANAWDEVDEQGQAKSVHLLACRLTSGSTVFSAGNIAGPIPRNGMVKQEKQKNKGMSFFSKYDGDYQSQTNEQAGPAQSYFDEPSAAYSDDIEATPQVLEPVQRGQQALDPHPVTTPGSQVFELPEEIWDWTDSDEDQCRLYHYNFSLETGKITSEYALARIPFEFPSVRSDMEMKGARYVYGCSTSCASFGAALGKSAKIDVLVKIDTERLIAQGERQLAAGLLHPVTDCVDKRSLAQILDSSDPEDTIRAFHVPHGWFLQEPRFVPRHNSQSEDDGYLLTYAFDEEQLNEQGEVPSDDDTETRAKSELWIIDAKDMTTVVGRVSLPQRVPYGLHGTWFSDEEIQGQRAVDSVRSTAQASSKRDTHGVWMKVRDRVERILA